MHIVIDIPEEYCTDNIVNELDCLLTDYFGGTICKIALLPKGHGRLIDVNDLDITTIETDDYSGNEILDVVTKEDLDEAPTIIPADESEEG
jgi:hypothetical protein